MVLKGLGEGAGVQFRRGLFSHWGIYDGKENIIHLAGVDACKTAVGSSMSNAFTSSGPGFNKACVKKENFWKVAGNSYVMKNNITDTIKAPFLGREIVKRALSRIGPQPYNIVGKNCEHFASWARNGIPVSFQVQTVLTVAGYVVAAVVVAFVAYKLYVHREKVARGIK